MIGFVGEDVDRDFHRALMKASLRRWRGRLMGSEHRERLLSFDEVMGELDIRGQVYRGLRIVEVEKISGSVGRYRDFDPSFLPLRVSVADRWGRVDEAYHRGIDLPPVSLYKIGDCYFVSDGNHRVSVARYHGAAAIDAEVVQIIGTPREGGSKPAATAKPSPPPSPLRKFRSVAWGLREALFPTKPRVVTE